MSGEPRPSKRLATADGGRGLRPTEFPPDSRPRYCRCEDERERWDSGEGRCVKCGKTIRRASEIPRRAGPGGFGELGSL